MPRKKKGPDPSKTPATFRYDSSLSPALDWDGRNPAREEGERLIREIFEARTLDEARAAARVLAALSRPFLDWAGKAEAGDLDPPALPLFAHESLSAKDAIETVAGRGAGPAGIETLRAYEHAGGWVNRLILGDSLAVMSSLLRREGLGGRAGVVYMDPPYGVKFGSNFQPFLRRRDVRHDEDADMTREPEMVRAYRDTWELGLHSYLTYLRDRLILARELLAPTGSIFVQIGDANVHHVRELLDEVFGPENFVAIIPFRKKTMPLGSKLLEQMHDFILWYAREREEPGGRLGVKYRPLFVRGRDEPDSLWCWCELPDGTRRRLASEEIARPALIPEGARIYRLKSLEPSGRNEGGLFDFEFEGKTYRPPRRGWATGREGMEALRRAGRLQPNGSLLNYVLFHDDFPVSPLTSPWNDTVGPQDKRYVVQTGVDVIARCILMTTDPGDLVIDPTCGSGSTALAAERWGRRWIAIDASRVPLAIARERILTARFPWFEVRDPSAGPAGGFVYRRRRSRRGEEAGGIVPHITLGSIAKGEPPAEEVLVDRPEVDGAIVRVSGPFRIESLIPPPAGAPGAAGKDRSASAERMLEILRKSPVIHLPGNRTMALENIRPPAGAFAVSAEARMAGEPVGIVFGPEDGAVAEETVLDAARECRRAGFRRLLVIGFAIGPAARSRIEECEAAAGVPAAYIQASPDLLLGGLLKGLRSSEIFSACGSPDVRLHSGEAGGETEYRVELLGLDVFDPIAMASEHRDGRDVPAWFLDEDYDGSCFRVSQAFFPRTGSWERLRRALGTDVDEATWEILAGTTSAPFRAGKHRRSAVKVIDDRGNELIAIVPLDARAQEGS